MDLSSGRPTRTRQTIVAVLEIVVSVVSLMLVARSVDVAETGQILANASIGQIALGLIVFLVGLGVRVLIWYVLLPDRPDGSRVTGRATGTCLDGGVLGQRHPASALG